MPVIMFPNSVDELLSSDDALALCAAVAEAGAQQGKENTPQGETGFEKKAVVSGGEQIIDGIASAQFGSVSQTWHITEFGSVHNPAYRPLTRAAQSLGIEFRPE